MMILEQIIFVVALDASMMLFTLLHRTVRTLLYDSSILSYHLQYLVYTHVAFSLIVQADSRQSIALFLLATVFNAMRAVAG